jgi:hypothetical protein
VGHNPSRSFDTESSRVGAGWTGDYIAMRGIPFDGEQKFGIAHRNPIREFQQSSMGFACREHDNSPRGQVPGHERQMERVSGRVAPHLIRKGRALPHRERTSRQPDARRRGEVPFPVPVVGHAPALQCGSDPNRKDCVTLKITGIKFAA